MNYLRLTIFALGLLTSVFVPLSGSISQTVSKPEPDESQASALPPSVQNAAAPCGRQLYNGEVLEGELVAVEFSHRLVVDNSGNRSAAVVKVQGVANDVLTRFYVAAGSTAELSNIPDGQYNIAFAIGGRLAADCATVIQPTSTERFPAPHSFVTAYSQDSVQTRVLTVTLFETRSGNVDPRPISVADFNRD